MWPFAGLNVIIKKVFIRKKECILDFAPRLSLFHPHEIYWCVRTRVFFLSDCSRFSL